MIPVDATNPQVAEYALQALIPEGALSPVQNNNTPEGSGQSETSPTPVQSSESGGSTLSDLQPAESSAQSSNQDEQNQDIPEGEEDDELPELYGVYGFRSLSLPGTYQLLEQH